MSRKTKRAHVWDRAEDGPFEDREDGSHSIDPVREKPKRDVTLLDSVERRESWFDEVQKRVECGQTGGLSRLAVCVIGPNGSGKSSAIKTIGLDDMTIPGTDEPLYSVNADTIAKAMRREGFTGDDAALAKAAQRRADQIRERLLEQGYSFVNETVGSHPSRVEFLEKARGIGYTVVVLFVSTESAEINVRRVEERVARGGHDVPREKILQRYERTMRLARDYLEVADCFIAFDNSADNVQGGNEAMRRLLTAYRGEIRLTSAGREVKWVKEYLLGDE